MTTAVAAPMFDLAWLRRARGIRGFLEEKLSPDPSGHARVTFAITWAPTPGSSAHELLAASGMHRTKFPTLLGSALQPRDHENLSLRNLKSELHENLSCAWR